MVANRTWCWVSRLTSRIVRIAMTSLNDIPELFLITRQESWRRWTNTILEGSFLPKLEIIPQVPVPTQEKPWDFPLSARWGLIPLHCVQSNSVFSIKHLWILDLLDGTPQSSQEHSEKSRRTLMLPQEWEIAQCTPNLLEMKPTSPSLAPESSRVPRHKRQWLDFL